MKGAIAFLLTLIFSYSGCVAADQTLGDETFRLSAFDFTYRVPTGFGSHKMERGYFPTPMGSVPFSNESWFSKTDSVAVKTTVMPPEWWQSRSSNALAEARENLLSEPKVKLISENSYSISGCPAYSASVERPDQPHFQRLDYFLIQPELRVVMYASPNSAGLASTACKNFFESISIKLKQAR